MLLLFVQLVPFDSIFSSELVIKKKFVLDRANSQQS